jgi:hypothetical protein
VSIFFFNDKMDEDKLVNKTVYLDIPIFEQHDVNLT